MPRFPTRFAWKLGLLEPMPGSSGFLMVVSYEEIIGRSLRFGWRRYGKTYCVFVAFLSDKRQGKPQRLLAWTFLPTPLLRVLHFPNTSDPMLILASLNTHQYYTFWNHSKSPPGIPAREDLDPQIQNPGNYYLQPMALRIGRTRHNPWYTISWWFTLPLRSRYLNN